MDIELLQEMCRHWGWPSLVEYEHVIPADAQVVRWYESHGPKGIFLQLNHKEEQMSACVFAIRYRLCSGWHSFMLPKTCALAIQEAKKLDHWLSIEWFLTSDKRECYRIVHPKTTKFTWKRLRDEGPPDCS
jgi:hypothetical protein